MHASAVNNLQSARMAWPLLTARPDWSASRGGDPWSRPEGQVMDSALSFGERTFGNIDLGDPRRTARLIKSADDMCRHPGGTLPDKFPKPADLRGFYRLMNRAEVTHEILMQAHAED